MRPDAKRHDGMRRFATGGKRIGRGPGDIGRDGAGRVGMVWQAAVWGGAMRGGGLGGGLGRCGAGRSSAGWAVVHGNARHGRVMAARGKAGPGMAESGGLERVGARRCYVQHRVVSGWAGPDRLAWVGRGGTLRDSARQRGAVRGGAERCGTVRGGAVRCGTVRGGVGRNRHDLTALGRIGWGGTQGDWAGRVWTCGYRKGSDGAEIDGARRDWSHLWGRLRS